jgi:hypothetical protein
MRNFQVFLSCHSAPKLPCALRLRPGRNVPRPSVGQRGGIRTASHREWPSPSVRVACGMPGDCYFLHRVGENSVGSGLRRRRLTWVAVVVAVLAAPTTTAVASPPAVDQYTQHLPGAGGNSGFASSSAPVAQPGQLPANVRAALSGPDGQLLTLIATAPALGAPAVTDSASGVTSGASGSLGTAAAVEGASGPSPALTTAVADAAGSGPGLALLGVLAGIGIAAAGVRLVRRSRTSL